MSRQLLENSFKSMSWVGCISFQEISYTGKPQVVSSYILPNLWLAPQLCLFFCWVAFQYCWPPGDVIFAQLACSLNDVIFCLHR